MTTKITTSLIADRAVDSLQLANTAVTAGTYGGAAAVGWHTVDAQGRITSATQTSVSIGTNQITYGGYQWFFNNDGTTQFPNYKFTASAGSSGQTLTSDGSGNVVWATPSPGASYAISATSSLTGSGITLTPTVGSPSTVLINSGTGITVAKTDSADMTITNTGVTGLTAGTGISLSGSTGNVTITNTAATTNQLVNGSYTLTLNADGTTSFPTYTFPQQ